MEKNKQIFLLSSVLILFFILDFFTKIALTPSEGYTTFVKIIKTIFVGYITFELIRSKMREPLKMIGIISLIPLISFLFSSWMHENWILFLRTLSLYIYPLLFLLYCASLKESTSLPILEKVFAGIVWVVNVSVILGFITNWPILRTYDFHPRFGYMGIIQKSITASYFYCGAIFFAYQKYHQSLNWYLFFISTLFCSLLIGTKSVYLFVAMFSVYLFIKHQLYKNKNTYVIGGISILLFSFFYERLFIFIKTKFFVLYEVYEQYGIVTAIFSLRDLIFKDNILHYKEKWSIVNYLFGGIDVQQHLFEMSFFDLFVFFGLLGTLLYSFLFFKFIYSFFNIPKKSAANFFLISIVIISSISGQFFLNNSVITCFFIVILLINHKNRSTRVFIDE